ncbi:hypothetical protein [Streptomyces yangpuensis]
MLRAARLLPALPELLRVPAGATMHDLRHFYASLLIKRRENVKTV